MNRNTSTPPKNKSLTIRLSESAVYLPTDTPNGRSRRNSETRTSMLRGLLVLELAKPMKISNISVELIATTFNAWPEGVGARRIEIKEEHHPFHASTVYFDANTTSSLHRRTMSIGPGTTAHGYDYNDLGWEDDEEEGPPLVTTGEEGHNAGLVDSLGHNTARSRPLLVPSAESSDRPSRPRRVSFDSQNFIRVPVSHNEDLADVPVPPYSAVDPASPTFVTSPLFPTNNPSVHYLPVHREASVSRSQDPAQELEDFRTSLNSNLRAYPFSNSTLSLRSGADRSLSRTTSRHMVDVPEDGDMPESGPTLTRLSPTNHSGSPSLDGSGSNSGENLAQTTSPERSLLQRDRSHSRDALLSPNNPSTSRSRDRGRKDSRFSLSAVTDAFREVVRSTSSSRAARLILPSLERSESETTASLFRSRNRSTDGSLVFDERQRSRGRTMDRRLLPVSAEDESEAQLSGLSPTRLTNSSISDSGSHTRQSLSLPRPSVDVGRVFGEHDIKGKPVTGHGWKEFKKGTYTYPISFSIPCTAPPTLQSNFGSVVWRLNATVHRPGTLTKKLTASRDVLVVSCPSEDETEDTENIIVERPWEQQLQYLISISGRSFFIGGTVPITFTLMPLEKVKFHRFSVFIEERVDYYTHMSRIAKSDPVTRFDLLSVKGEGGKNAPQLLPLDSDDVDALKNSPLYSIMDAEADESDMAAMMMGPGPWTFHQDLKLPASCKRMKFTNKNRRANIVVTHLLKTVMRVERGDDTHKDKSGKRRLFDIVVQTPIHILSCRCNPDWISLPRYSESFSDDSPVTPTCPCEINRQQQSEASPFSARRRPFSSAGESSSSTTVNQSASASPLAASDSTTAPAFQTSQHFERLVSGLETEFGEHPPSYASVVDTPSPGIYVSVST
ncbi:hypothetical protein FA15DRAFT_670775 [Coprinopsis marcescibilis]|uniref:Arrestin C-terminal-like domain-containing protein n=1 Tax=Coprinopsis marcescibilis TaxID=230819 RepID=A0A5C3KSH9_COPMA|nr:hypothetical protein FA15DRAFT_670775 [Coprinopsis marcescibilis]